MSHVRCRNSACQGRRTLRMHPDSYAPGRLPRCLRCGQRAGYRIDRWRGVYEVGPKAPRACRCGEYHFPHARGRGWCQHNQAVSLDARQERWESGGRQGL